MEIKIRINEIIEKAIERKLKAEPTNLRSVHSLRTLQEHFVLVYENFFGVDWANSDEFFSAIDRRLGDPDERHRMRVTLDNFGCNGQMTLLQIMSELSGLPEDKLNFLKLETYG